MAVGLAKHAASANSQVTLKGLSGLAATASKAAGHVVGATGHTMKDVFTKQNSHLSFGQKLNQHLSNKITGKEEEGLS